MVILVKFLEHFIANVISPIQNLQFYSYYIQCPETCIYYSHQLNVIEYHISHSKYQALPEMLEFDQQQLTFNDETNKLAALFVDALKL
jgi:hypothetical protein